MRSKRWVAVAMSMMMAVAVVVPMHVRAEEPTVKVSGTPGIEVDTKIQDPYQFTYQGTKSIKFVIKNGGDVDLTNVKINPVVDNATNPWRFENASPSESYEKTIPKMEKNASAEVTYDLRAKADAPGGWYAAEFTITSAEGLNVKHTIYTITTEKPTEQPAPQPTPTPTPTLEEPSIQPEQPTGDAGGADGGGFSNAQPTATNGAVGVPRVIVTGFSTDPGTVTAGSNFKLIIHLQNTSKATAVSNMLFDLQAPNEGADANTAAPSFLPASGSSSIYLDKIPAGGTKDVAIDLNCRADLVQKPYSIAMTMKYEDSNKTQFEGASSLSIPVKQAARFEFSDFEINPDTLAVGEEGNVTCSLYNLGRTKLHNVKAKFTGNGISSKDVFVGNVESGASASIDGMITGEKKTPEDNIIKMTVTYEDEAGTLATTEKTFKLGVTEQMAADAGVMPIDAPKEKKLPVIPMVIAVVVLAGIVIGIVWYKKKKKKALDDAEGELTDEIDRPSEDE
ncbi:MAG: hypothetical protein RR621_04280 [Lachnospiraceae bacterium]